jgi:hypothetical protein
MGLSKSNQKTVIIVSSLLLIAVVIGLIALLSTGIPTVGQAISGGYEEVIDYDNNLIGMTDCNNVNANPLLCGGFLEAGCLENPDLCSGLYVECSDHDYNYGQHGVCSVSEGGYCDEDTDCAYLACNSNVCWNRDICAQSFDQDYCNCISNNLDGVNGLTEARKSCLSDGKITCVDDSNCYGYESCVNNECVTFMGTDCSDSDCIGYMGPNDYQCCSLDLDCPAGTSCLNNECHETNCVDGEDNDGDSVFDLISMVDCSVSNANPLFCGGFLETCDDNSELCYGLFVECSGEGHCAMSEGGYCDDAWDCAYLNCNDNICLDLTLWDRDSCLLSSDLFYCDSVYQDLFGGMSLTEARKSYSPDQKIYCVDDSNCYGYESCVDNECVTSTGIDCLDLDCSDKPICGQIETNCVDGENNDGDAYLDCADSDCVERIGPNNHLCCSLDENCPAGTSCLDNECHEIVCDDLIDNDGDNLVDCADSDCVDEINSLGLTCCDYTSTCPDETSHCDTDTHDGSNQCVECIPGENHCAEDMTCSNNKCVTEVCDDLIDNDGDNLADCLDIDDCSDQSCGDGCVCMAGEKTETICDDNLNNDNDWAGGGSAGSPIELIDCDDPDCFDNPACVDEEICDNGLDEDGDTLIDCLDIDDCSDQSCGDGCVCMAGEKTETICDDNLNNDGDRSTTYPPRILIDCLDSDCDTEEGSLEGSLCEFGIELTCNDGFDNDGDGLIDCSDDNCIGLVGGESEQLCDKYSESSCDDNFDNNANGETDCEEYSCRNDLACESIGILLDVCKTSGWEEGYTYGLTEDIIGVTEPCMIIDANDITLNCGGHKLVQGESDTNLNGIKVIGNNVILKNCDIQNFNRGIALDGIGNKLIDSKVSLNYIGVTIIEDGTSLINNMIQGNEKGIHIDGPVEELSLINNVICGNDGYDVTRTGEILSSTTLTNFADTEVPINAQSCQSETNMQLQRELYDILLDQEESKFSRVISILTNYFN